MTSKHRAFVAGATGYTGQRVVTALRGRHIDTVAHVRPDSADLARWTGRFKDLGASIDTTPWDDGAMAATLARLRPTLVFALLGTTRARMRAVAARGGDPDEAGYEAVDYGLTALLLRAAAGCGTSPRFVYLSAAGVGPAARTAYTRVRHRAEAEIEASGLPYTIARPSFITGPDRDEDRPAERLGAMLVDAALFAAGTLGARRLQRRYGSTDASTLAAALVRLALDPAAASTTVESEDLRG